MADDESAGQKLYLRTKLGTDPTREDPFDRLYEWLVEFDEKGWPEG